MLPWFDFFKKLCFFEKMKFNNFEKVSPANVKQLITSIIKIFVT